MEKQPENVFVNEENLKQSSKASWFSKGMVIKAVFLIVLSVVAVEIYLGIQYLNGSSNNFFPQLSLDEKPQEAEDSTKMFLIADKNQLKVGDKVNVEIRLATLGRTIKSSTIVLKYDPTILGIESKPFFTNGDVFSANPVITNPQGLIRISAATGSPVNGYTGVGAMGVLQFSAKKAGNTQVSIELGANNSNTISLDEQNILGGVSNLNLTVEN